MKPKNDANGPKKATSPAPRKRFHLEKLEERVAPTPHLNPHTKMVGGGNGGGGGGSASGSSITISGTGTY